MSDIVIEVSELSKKYSLSNEKGDSEVKMALNPISFNVNKGERWGVIGKNGSGKSTLLKILSGIIKPSSGHATLYGSVAHILSVGDNFIPDLTGKENTEMFFRLHGLSSKKASEAFDKAAEFADIGNYVYSPVKTYSDGMYLRLAFSACLQLSGNILLVDEIFSAGDASFREKLKKHFTDKFKTAETMIMVSHDPDEIISYCTHCLWLDKGNIMFAGKAKEVETAYYYELYKEDLGKEHNQHISGTGDGQKASFLPIENDCIRVNNFVIDAPLNDIDITYDTGVRFNISIDKKQAGMALHPAIRIHNYLMSVVMMLVPQANSATENSMRAHQNTVGQMNIEITLPPHILAFGNYYAEIIFARNFFMDKDKMDEAIKVPTKVHFEVKQGEVYDYADELDNSSIKPQCDWKITVNAQ